MASNQRVTLWRNIRCYSRVIVRYNDAPTARRHAVVATLVVLVVLVAGTGWQLTERSPAAHHGPHALSSSISVDFAATDEHPHAQDGSAPTAPDAFAEAALPRTVTLLVSIGLAAIIGAAYSWRSKGATVVIRGPPRWGGYLISGQQLLLRLCIARR